MRADNKRFLIILACLFIGFPVVDVAVKWSRNAILQLRFDQVVVGMSEAEAIRLTGHDAFARTSNMKEIMVPVHQSLFETFFPPPSVDSQIVTIETGRVVGVASRGMNFVQ